MLCTFSNYLELLLQPLAKRSETHTLRRASVPVLSEFRDYIETNNKHLQMRKECQDKRFFYEDVLMKNSICGSVSTILKVAVSRTRSNVCNILTKEDSQQVKM